MPKAASSLGVTKKKGPQRKKGGKVDRNKDSSSGGIAASLSGGTGLHEDVRRQSFTEKKRIAVIRIKLKIFSKTLNRANIIGKRLRDYFLEYKPHVFVTTARASISRGAIFKYKKNVIQFGLEREWSLMPVQTKFTIARLE